MLETMKATIFVGAGDEPHLSINIGEAFISVPLFEIDLSLFGESYFGPEHADDVKDKALPALLSTAVFFQGIAN